MANGEGKGNGKARIMSNGREAGQPSLAHLQRTPRT